MLLNQTIVSDVARVHLGFVLCDDSLHIPLLLGDVPDGTSAGTGTRGRVNRHKTQTSSLSLTESWCRVIFWMEQVRNVRSRRDALFGIIDNWVVLIGLIVRGSTRRYGCDLNQVGQVLEFGFLVGFITSEKARDA